ncbi:hypothetical protein K503DRAFT_727157 [Rhizopogon vinicolor AM-OR11-026]|uniref:G domain-containing protein n=1 Tax=Rhizopogon vinicolor AM-OR11-026 TaxID=1314800 RepID=A0A1B7MI57_9AGAM|nr:hypothetical protein K503DRAFT_727157 [Rhizopogon vinicolor AM-OR11-026]
MLALNSAYVLVLEVINGSNFVVPSHRMPAGLYGSVSTAYGQWNTAIGTVMADSSVPWNESLVIQGRPLKFPQWLMPIFPSTSKAVHLEIRASFETIMFGRGELVGIVETTLEELLMHGKQFEVPLSAVKTRAPSLLLRAQRIKLPGPHAACGIQHSEVDVTTDAAHEAYALYRQSNHRNDLDIALERFQTVLDQCPPGHPHRAAALSNISHAILYGFTKGVGTDIDYVIFLFRSALELRPPGNPDHLLSIFDLCKALHQRHLHLQKGADLREVVKLYLYLLPLCAEGSYLQLCVIEKCNALPRNPSDESISLRRTVLDLCRKHPQHHARSLNRLAGDLYARFEPSGDIDDINEAVHLSCEALALCPSDGERSFFLSVLSYTLKLRFHHLRYADDIHECISLNREALVLRPVGHPAREKTFNNLAKALKARYDQYGDITDLEEAMRLSRAAHDLRSGISGEHVDLRRDQSTPEYEDGQRQPLIEAPTSDHQIQRRARNVVIFGPSGSGKSSVINAIAQRHIAEVSNDATGCTSHCQGHKIELYGESFVLFDTVGLGEGTAGTVPAAKAEKDLKSLLRELTSPKSDGLDLLVYCVGSGKDSGRISGLVRNYRLVYSTICQKKVPIVVVVTGLERYEPDMESWWSANEKQFTDSGMHFRGHACVATLDGDSDILESRSSLHITESCKSLRKLILNNSRVGA